MFDCNIWTDGKTEADMATVDMLLNVVAIALFCDPVSINLIILK